MNRTKVVLLSLIAVLQIVTIVGGFFAYREMSERLWKTQIAYKRLLEESGEVIVDFGLPPNPFAPLRPLVLLGLFFVIVLLVLEVRE